MHILLVEDDVLLAKGTATLLTWMGKHQVTVKSEPRDIVALCQSGEVDLVMMDVNLPGATWMGASVSGADVSRWLKTQPDTARIPIVLVTAYAMREERAPLLEASLADEFFTKPITDYAEILAACERLVHTTSEERAEND